MRIAYSGGVTLEVDITDEMITDHAECGRLAARGGPGKACDGCSLDIGVEGASLCEMPAVTEEIQRMESMKGGRKI